MTVDGSTSQPYTTAVSAASYFLTIRPLVKRGRTDAVGAAQLRDWRAGLSLLENAQNLAVGKSRFLQGNLLGVDYEKIPLLADTLLWGDYLVFPLISMDCGGVSESLPLSQAPHWSEPQDHQDKRLAKYTKAIPSNK